MAENAGLNPIEAVSESKAQQLSSKNPYLGIDCQSEGTADMRIQKVYESFSSKKQQFELATQVVKMILKIDDVIEPTDYE